MAPHLSLAYSSQSAIYGTIASGWSLPIPAILEDTSQGRLRTHSPQSEQQDGVGTAKYDDDRFISTMAGSRTLIRVTEPTSLGVGWTYRAQADASYTRYERMSQGQPFFWRAYTTSGNVLTFGEASRMGNCQNVGWGYAPLTGEVDSFGNEIAYSYKVANSDAQDCVIDKITWGMNTNAGIAYPFAQVKFGWTVQTTLAPGAPAFSLGSQRDYRTGVLTVTGAVRLSTITASAFEPVQGGETNPSHTRVITLGYDTAKETVSATHAPLRVLSSIQESAWRGANQFRVDLPAVTFEYASESVVLGAPVNQPTAPWSVSPDHLSCAPRTCVPESLLIT